jgi:hypothetical protein
MSVAPAISPQAAEAPAPAGRPGFRLPGSLTVVLILAAHLPLLFLQAWCWWGDPLLGFAPLVLVGGILLGHRRSRGLGELGPGAHAWPVIGSMAGTALGVFLLAPEPVTIAAWLSVLAVAYAWGGTRLVRALLPSWALLGLLVPSVALVQGLSGTFQVAVSHAAGAVLDVRGVIHRVTPDAVELVGKRLPLTSACGGAVPCLPILAIVFFAACWWGRPAVHLALLLTVTGLWMFAGASAYVVVVALAHERQGWDLAEGWRRFATVGGLLLVGLGLVLSTDRLLLVFAASLSDAWQGTKHIFQRWMRRRAAARAYWENLGADEASQMFAHLTPEVPAATAAPGPTRLSRASQTLLENWLLGLGYLLIAAGGLAWSWPLIEAAGTGRDMMTAKLRDLPDDTPPEQIAGLARLSSDEERRRPDDPRGQYSRTWAYQGPVMRASVAIDFTLRGWRAFGDDMPAGEWVAKARTAVTEDGRRTVFATFLEDPSDRHGVAYAEVIDRRGDVLGEPVSPFRDVAAFLSRVLIWHPEARRRLVGSYEPTARLRVLLEAPRPLRTTEVDRAREALDDFRGRIARRLGEEGETR